MIVDLLIHAGMLRQVEELRERTAVEARQYNKHRRQDAPGRDANHDHAATDRKIGTGRPHDLAPFAVWHEVLAVFGKVTAGILEQALELLKSIFNEEQVENLT